MIVLTRILIEELRTPSGGFNKATIDALAIRWPLERGWIEVAIGRQVSNKSWAAARAASLAERHFFRGNTRRRRG